MLRICGRWRCEQVDQSLAKHDGRRVRLLSGSHPYRRVTGPVRRNLQFWAGASGRAWVPRIMLCIRAENMVCSGRHLARRRRSYGSGVYGPWEKEIPRRDVRSGVGDRELVSAVSMMLEHQAVGRQSVLTCEHGVEELDEARQRACRPQHQRTPQSHPSKPDDETCNTDSRQKTTIACEKSPADTAH